MFKEIPLAYAVVFFLGIALYTPILLFSTEKYKSGLKCAVAICLWLMMMIGTVTLLCHINPELMRSLGVVPFSALQEAAWASNSSSQIRPAQPSHHCPKGHRRIGRIRRNSHNIMSARILGRSVQIPRHTGGR